MISVFDNILSFIDTFGSYSVLISTVLILIEALVPMLPIFVFITVDYYVLGPLFGFIVSYIFTVLGCISSYMIFKYGFGDKFDYLTRNKKMVKKYTTLFKNISTGKLVLIISFPFTPSFFVNVAAGLTKMDFKKYLTALLFGKVALVVYCGYVGVSLIESFKNPIILLKIVILILFIYLIYRICDKLFNLGGHK
jgi:uncharacterized membrane protein YdjX (TVP38/TMEM64 family)